MRAEDAAGAPRGSPPDPAGLGTLDDVASYLGRLRTWAGRPSYPELVRRINSRRGPREQVRQTTVYDCFRRGRRRLDPDLVLGIAGALGLDEERRSRLRRAVAVAHGDSGVAAVADVRPSLPAPSPTFTGRARELRTIAEAAATGGPDPRPVVIVGPAGVGKTDLALAAAHRLAEPAQTQLFVDLHGFDPDRPPASPDAVLVGILRQLGVTGERIHRCRTVAQKAALFRTLLADLPAILLLDNAAGELQVRHLLPGSHDCLVLVTSRRRFRGATGSTVVSLAGLSGQDALDLLRRHDPAGRVDAEPDQARRLAEDLCSGMPLDLVALGGRLADPREAGWSLADHLARLEWFPRDEVSRPSLAASYHDLPEPTRRLFRALSLHPGGDFTGYDAAALGEVPLAGADPVLTELHDRHLLLQRQPGRFQFHDAVRAYSERLRHAEDPRSAQEAALDRLLHYHRCAAEVAMGRLRPAGAAPDRAEAVTAVPRLTDAAAAMAWLDAERANLVAGGGYAADHGRPAHTSRLSAILHRYLDPGGHWYDAEVLHAHACRTGDPSDRAVALVNLGYTRYRLAAYDQAIAQFREARDHFRRTGDRNGEGRTFNGLGLVYERLGRFDDARACWERALEAARETGKRQNEAAVLSNLGVLEVPLRRYDEAVDHHQRALAVNRDIGNRPGEAIALENLGYVYTTMGRYEMALDHLRRAVEIVRETGDRYLEAHALANIGTVHRHQGRHREALRQLRDVLRRYRALGDREGEVFVLNELATTLRSQGHLDRAGEHHRQALRLACETGLRVGQARAHDGLARVLERAGDPAGAAAEWKHAWALYRDLDLPEADEIAARLGR